MQLVQHAKVIVIGSKWQNKIEFVGFLSRTIISLLSVESLDFPSSGDLAGLGEWNWVESIDKLKIKAYFVCTHSPNTLLPVLLASCIYVWASENCYVQAYCTRIVLFFFSVQKGQNYCKYLVYFTSWFVHFSPKYTSLLGNRMLYCLSFQRLWLFLEFLKLLMKNISYLSSRFFTKSLKCDEVH